MRVPVWCRQFGEGWWDVPPETPKAKQRSVTHSWLWVWGALSQTCRPWSLESLTLAISFQVWPLGMAYSVTVVIFLTSSLGLEMFISAANPVCSLEDLPLYASAWIFQEPGDSLRWRRQSSSTSHLGGENSSHHSVACIDSAAAALLLQLGLTGSAWQLDLDVAL